MFHRIVGDEFPQPVRAQQEGVTSLHADTAAAGADLQVFGSRAQGRLQLAAARVFARLVGSQHARVDQALDQAVVQRAVTQAAVAEPVQA